MNSNRMSLNYRPSQSSSLVISLLLVNPILISQKLISAKNYNFALEILLQALAKANKTKEIETKANINYLLGRIYLLKFYLGEQPDQHSSELIALQNIEQSKIEEDDLTPFAELMAIHHAAKTSSSSNQAEIELAANNNLQKSLTHLSISIQTQPSANAHYLRAIVYTELNEIEGNIENELIVALQLSSISVILAESREKIALLKKLWLAVGDSNLVELSGANLEAKQAYAVSEFQQYKKLPLKDRDSRCYFLRAQSYLAFDRTSEAIKDLTVAIWLAQIETNNSPEPAILGLLQQRKLLALESFDLALAKSDHQQMLKLIEHFSIEELDQLYWENPLFLPDASPKKYHFTKNEILDFINWDYAERCTQIGDKFSQDENTDELQLSFYQEALFIYSNIKTIRTDNAVLTFSSINTVDALKLSQDDSNDYKQKISESLQQIKHIIPILKKNKRPYTEFYQIEHKIIGYMNMVTLTLLTRSYEQSFSLLTQASEVLQANPYYGLTTYTKKIRHLHEKIVAELNANNTATITCPTTTTTAKPTKKIVNVIKAKLSEKTLKQGHELLQKKDEKLKTTIEKSIAELTAPIQDKLQQSKKITTKNDQELKAQKWFKQIDEIKLVITEIHNETIKTDLYKKLDDIKDDITTEQNRLKSLTPLPAKKLTLSKAQKRRDQQAKRKEIEVNKQASRKTSSAIAADSDLPSSNPHINSNEHKNLVDTPHFSNKSISSEVELTNFNSATSAAVELNQINSSKLSADEHLITEASANITINVSSAQTPYSSNAVSLTSEIELASSSAPLQLDQLQELTTDTIRINDTSSVASISAKSRSDITIDETVQLSTKSESELANTISLSTHPDSNGSSPAPETLSSKTISKNLCLSDYKNYIPRELANYKVNCNSASFIKHQAKTVFLKYLVLQQLAADTKTILSFIGGGLPRDIFAYIKEPRDIDIFTNATDEEIYTAFGIIDEVDKKFRYDKNYGKTFAIPPRYTNGFKVEITQSIHLLNEALTPINRILQLALSGDFTINAGYLDCLDNLYFPLGKLTKKDLKKNPIMIRTIQSAAASLAEDPRRALRAIKFVTSLQANLDPELAQAIKSLPSDVFAGIDKNKLNVSMRDLFATNHAALSFEMMNQLQILDKLFPGMAALQRHNIDWLFYEFNQIDSSSSIYALNYILNYIYMFLAISTVSDTSEQALEQAYQNYELIQLQYDFLNSKNAHAVKDIQTHVLNRLKAYRAHQQTLMLNSVTHQMQNMQMHSSNVAYFSARFYQQQQDYSQQSTNALYQHLTYTGYPTQAMPLQTYFAGNSSSSMSGSQGPSYVATVFQPNSHLLSGISSRRLSANAPEYVPTQTFNPALYSDISRINENFSFHHLKQSTITERASDQSVSSIQLPPASDAFKHLQVNCDNPTGQMPYLPPQPAISVYQSGLTHFQPASHRLPKLSNSDLVKRQSSGSYIGK